MAFSEPLAARVRLRLEDLCDFEERRMFGGAIFFLDGKMCLGVIGEFLMVRLDPAEEASFLALPGARPMDFTGRPIRGYLFVDPETLEDSVLETWIQAALAFNPKAKASKKR